MTSRLFDTAANIEIAQRVRAALNAHEAFLSPATINSPRAVGDAIERLLGDSFGALLGEWCAEYSANFARRAMADLAFRDVDDYYYVVDVKTHRTDTRFNMPNLTSVERLARFYEDDHNYFAVLLINYHIEADRITISDVRFAPIEFLGWDCLTIGALGWGQIQIADANVVAINPRYPRAQWMLELCDALLAFYPKEIAKIGERIGYFERVREFWQSRAAQDHA